MAGDADRNLLLGILAHQMDFVGRDDLFAAMHAWLLDKERPLGALLVEQGRLSAARRSILESLVDEHVRAHGGVAARSLEAVGLVPGIVNDLDRLADADVRMSVAHARGDAARSLAREPPAPDAGPDDPWMTQRMASLGATSAVGGRFRIVRPHAQGGLGIVSVAIDNELDREVAFKEIQPTHADRETSRARFMLEAEFTGKLEHPGIIPIYGLGQDAAGRPFYAMRLIRGDSLADAINRFHDSGRGDASGPRAGRELRDLLGRFIDVCDAIAYAHSRGVLHRDLKPGNVMLGPYGETMVVDWGLAMPLEQPPVDSASPEGLVRPSKADSGSLPSERGAAIGTPLYMPPEQAEGALDRLGPASDVYGLGAILYELLTGRPPVSGTRVEEVLDQVRRGAIVPPRQVAPQVPAALEAVCLKALALRPEDRYASPRGLAADIKAWLADEPVSARREPLLTWLWRWVRRHRSAAAALAAALLAGLVGLGAVAIVQTRARRDLSAVNDDLDRKNTELSAANAALDAQRHIAETRRQYAIDAVRRFSDIVASDAELKNDRALAALRRRLLNEPLTYFRRLRDSFVADGDDNPAALEQLAAANADLGKLAAAIGDMEDALAARGEEVAVRERIAAGATPAPAVRRELASARVEQADLLAAAGHLADAIASYAIAADIQTALVAEQPTVPIHRSDLVTMLRGLAQLWHDARQPEEARAALEQAAVHQRVLCGADATDRARHETLRGILADLRTALAASGLPTAAIDAELEALGPPPPEAGGPEAPPAVP